MPDLNKALGELIKNNIAFHTIIENEVRLTPYGQITVNVEVIEGKAVLKSMNLVKNRRYRYDNKVDKPENMVE